MFKNSFFFEKQNSIEEFHVNELFFISSSIKLDENNCCKTAGKNFF